MALRIRDQELAASQMIKKGAAGGPEIVVVETEGQEVSRLNREYRKLQKAHERLKEEKEAVEDMVKEKSRGSIEQALRL